MLDNAAVLASIRSFKFKPVSTQPRVLFGADDLPMLRERAQRRPGLIERVRAAAEKLLATDAKDPNELQVYVGTSEAMTMAQACLLTGDERFGRWSQHRIEAAMPLKTWMAPVHVGGCRVYDHCMGNISAHIAIAHDLTHHLYTPAQTDALVDGLRRQVLLNFLDATGDKPEWWAKPDTESNWKIMTCGDSGTAWCAFVDRWPEANEAIARAARGVLETLDAVPAEGDWYEGVNYWFATLMLGLRFARTLRRLSGGAINLFEHPVLKKTGDFPTMLSTPGGRTYNFNDDSPALAQSSSEALAMLAAENRRGDWMRVARIFPTDSPLFLACDDPAIADAVPTKTMVVFPRSGSATMRTGWTPADKHVFVGFKSGPSVAGHSHLDANSFVIEAHGKPIAIENPYWPQAHFLGFFDSYSGTRWNFDGPGTVGHSTLMVDGKGQGFGVEQVGHITRGEQRGNRSLLVGDASKCYPATLKKYIRSIMLIAPDAIVIRDVVECNGPRSVEWLIHYAGAVRSEGLTSVIENEGVRVAITPLLPDRRMGWRVNDVTRASTYENSDTLKIVTQTVRYRSFGMFQPGEKFEFLFAMRVNGDTTGADWEFAGEAGKWTLRDKRGGETITPQGDSLAL